LALRAGDVDARAMKGQAALELGRSQEAADDFTMVLEGEPGRHSVRYYRAELSVRLGKFPEALADLDLLIQHFPKDPTLYELRSRAHDQMSHREQAQADIKKAGESPRAGARHYNDRAWTLATGPLALRDPQQALDLARKAVALTAGQADYLNTLGVAQYRAGQFALAIATLEQSLEAGDGASDAFDLFFLAMARHKLGLNFLGRADFDRAVKWRRDHPNLPAPYPTELDAFQAEAQALLDGPALELPANAFAPDRAR
jgi:tetratricopeptide (TPR) repeat protein